MIVTPKYYYIRMAPEPEALWYEACQEIFSQVACLKDALFKEPVFAEGEQLIAEQCGGIWVPPYYADFDVFPDFSIFDRVLARDKSTTIEQTGVLTPREGAVPHLAYLYENRGHTVESHLRGKYKYNYLRELGREKVFFRTGNDPLHARVFEVLQGRLLTKTFGAASLAYAACSILRLQYVYQNLPQVQLHDQHGGFSVWIRQPQGWVFYFLYQPPGKALGRQHVHEFLQNHLPVGDSCLLHVSHPFNDDSYAGYKKAAANVKQQVFSLLACAPGSGFNPPHIDLDTNQVITDET